MEKIFTDNGSKAHQRNDLVYFFCWENVPGKDTPIIIEFLTQEMGINWVETAKIEKENSDTIIRISKDDNFVGLKLNATKDTLKLIIDWEKNYNEFTVKNENGKLNIYRKDKVDRAYDYKQWHRYIPNSKCYAWDVDFIEWRYHEGKPIPVALTELTRVDKDITVSPSYLKSIEERFFKRDKQGETTRYLADKLGIPAYIILFKQCCTEFWVYDVEKKKWNKGLSPLKMKTYIEGL